nr:TRAP transporter substrate-binding protein DctP [uncultured Halomonas sp.]
MFNKRAKPVLAYSVLTAALLTAIGTVHAADRVLKFHNGYAESRPESGYVDDFAERVKELSSGSLEIDVYHAASLGLNEPDMLRILQRGVVDMALLYGEYYTRDAPALAAVYAQGAIKTPQQHLDLLPTLRDVYSDLYADWGIETIGGIVSPVFSVGMHCNEPVNSLEELQDKKVRVWSAHLVDTFTRLDISAQVIPQNDMYMALQTGVVDCAYYLSTVAETVSLNEVTDYEAYIHPWAAVPAMFGVSEKTWQSLDEEHQKLLKKAGQELWEETRAKAVDEEREAKARERHEELGVTILEPFNQEDVENFQQAAFASWEKITHRAGEKGEAAHSTVTKKLQEVSE